MIKTEPLEDIPPMQFLSCLDKLAVQIQGLELRSRIVSEVTAHILAVNRGENREPAFPFVAVPIGLALLHLGMGTPLHLSDELMDAWAAQDSGEVAECSGCGYRMPLRFSACLLCGSRTGEAGIFAKTRARVAGMN